MLNATFERLQRSFEQSARFSADASHHLKAPIAILRADVEEIVADVELQRKHTSARRRTATSHSSLLVQSWTTCFYSPAPMLAGVELSKAEFDVRRSARRRS